MNCPADQRARLKRRQGVPYPLQEAVTVINPETMQPRAARRRETIGEVMFRGNIVMKGYLNQPRRPQRKPSPVAGSTPATSACSTSTAMSSSRTAPKDIIISGGKTSRPSKSRMCSTSTPP